MEANKIFKPFLAALAAKNGLKSFSPALGYKGGQVPKIPTPAPSRREGVQIFMPFLAAFAAKNGI